VRDGQIFKNGLEIFEEVFEKTKLLLAALSPAENK
jgi:hypothetical protein